MHRRRIETNYLSKSGKISPIFIVFFLALPLFVTIWHFNGILEKRSKRNHLLARTTLISEMNKFHQSLSISATIEEMMQQVEKELKLKNSHKDPQKFIAYENPEQFDSQTATKIQNHLKAKYGIEAAYIVSVGYQGTNIDSLIPSIKDIEPKMLDIMNRFMAFSISEKFANNPNNSAKIKENIFKNHNNNHPFNGIHAINLLRYYFSPLIRLPSTGKISDQSSISYIGGKKVFLYLNGFTSKEKFLGGYLCIFTDKDFSSEFVLNFARKSSSNFLKRQLIPFRNDLKNRFVNKKRSLSYYEPIRTNFTTDFSHFTLNKQNNKNKFMLKTSLEKDYFFASINFFQKLVKAINLFTVLFAFTVGIFYSLFSSNLIAKLKTQFFFLIVFIIAIPFILISYFSGQLISRIEYLRTEILKIESAAHIFKIQSYLNDLKIKRQLIGFRIKKVLTDKASENRNFLKTFNKNKNFPQQFKGDIYFFDINGTERLFNQDSLPKDPPKISKFLSVKCLNDLGVLNLNSKKIRHDLKLVNLTHGFLSDFTDNYILGLNLAREGEEAKDLTEVNDINKMFFYLIPNKNKNKKSIIAITLLHLWGITNFGDFFDDLTTYTKLIFARKTPFVSHNYVLGERSIEGPIKKIYPSNIENRKEIISLLNYALVSKSSGSIENKNKKKTIISNWVYNPESDLILAGISTSEPDQWLKFFSWLFPAFVGIFSLTGIFLTRNILYVLLIKPIYSFIIAADKVGKGNFNTCLNIEKSDEFSYLAESFNEMTLNLEKREKFRRFISEKLYEKLKQDNSLDETFLKEEEISVLASDIRGFTSLTEKHAPEEIVLLLNEYFSEICQAIIEEGGVIERFIGDAVIAVFYKDDLKNSHAIRSVKAAISIKKKLHLLNEKRKSKGQFTINNGVGIVTDKATTSIITTNSGRKFFSLLGAVTAKAEELESLTAKIKKSRIIICENTFNSCKNAFSFNFDQIEFENRAFTPSVEQF